MLIQKVTLKVLFVSLYDIFDTIRLIIRQITYFCSDYGKLKTFSLD